MHPNVGTLDRIIRAVLGLGLMWAASQGVIGAWGWIGIVPLATAIFRFCPAYHTLGMNSCGTST
jgi:hypothetical protein